MRTKIQVIVLAAILLGLMLVMISSSIPHQSAPTERHGQETASQNWYEQEAEKQMAHMTPTQRARVDCKAAAGLVHYECLRNGKGARFCDAVQDMAVTRCDLEY